MHEKCSQTSYGRKATHIRLQKVQRLVLLLISGGMKSTPTDALEVIFNFPSLFLFIESEAIMDNYRVSVSEVPEVNMLVDENLKKKSILRKPS